MPRVVGVMVVAALACVALCTGQDTSDKQREAALDSAQKTTAALYDLIRSIAFPESPSLDNQPNEDNRFILLMPGKVLNYFDYYPGREYTRFIQEYITTMKEAIVPPHVMEKWFDLSDAMPNANPLFGQDSGRSLANEYATVLHETTIKNIQQQGEQILGAYNQAISFLKGELVADPEDVLVNTTRLTLYDRYRDLYNEKRLEMEDIIEQKRKSLRSLDYELWFQRHYPSLLSKVESAYTRWLIFGEKEMCDIYIAYLDSGTSAKNLEDARVALRSSGVSSLDRTRTIYPVSFEPSDWYKYLLPELQRPSRAQINQMLAKVTAKINAIEQIILFYANPPNTTQLNELKANFTAMQTKANASVETYFNTQLECMYNSMTHKSTHCNDYETASTTLLNNLNGAATAMADRDDFPLNSRTAEDYVKSLNNQKDELNRQHQQLYALLGQMDPLMGGILGADQLAVANLSDAYKDNNWLEFSFDQSSSYAQTTDSSSHESISASAGVNFLFYHVGGSYTHSTDKSHFEQHLASSNLKAKGKLLRVRIKRPWFKPEIFEDPTLSFVESDGGEGVTYVSPGKGISEEEFINEMLGKSKRQYRLPEYVTSFLLARDIELEFSGVDASTIRDTLDKYSHSSASGGFLFFRASSSVTKSSHRSQVTAARTANGMTIKIPGTQLIGYYTQKVPQFPQEQ